MLFFRFCFDPELLIDILDLGTEFPNFFCALSAFLRSLRAPGSGCRELPPPWSSANQLVMVDKN